MTGMRRRLPPIASLLAFEATARFSSLSRAAAELNVTQPAISRQLKLLERDLGVSLYMRRSRGIALTERGRELFEAISLGFSHILLAAENIRGRSRSSIALRSTTGFATFWLMPKLNAFAAIYPDVTLRLIVTDRETDMGDESVDIDVRFGTGHWPGTEAIRFLSGEAFAVCSPAFMDAHPNMTISDLPRLPLLEFSGINVRWMPWPVWFKAVGIDAVPPQPRGQFNNYPLLVEAAAVSQGLALGWRHLLDDHIRRGLLVRPFAESVETQDAFWLVRALQPAPSLEADLVWQWLLDMTP